MRVTARWPASDHLHGDPGIELLMSEIWCCPRGRLLLDLRRIGTGDLLMIRHERSDDQRGPGHSRTHEFIR
jgi:hypothetical protein